MTYIPPASSAVDFNLDAGPYLTPGTTATDFDLADAGGPVIVYPHIPSVIMSVSASWNRPAVKDLTLQARHQSAGHRDLRRRIATNQAGNVLDHGVHLAHSRTERRDLYAAAAWDSVATRDRDLRVNIHQAPEKDIETRSSPWESASTVLDGELRSSFLVKTPWKDRTLNDGWYSSAVHAPLWRREENYPVPVVIPVQGVAHFILEAPARPLRLGHFEIGARFENNPAQPKDYGFTARHGDAEKKDLKHRIPWGPAGQRDTTLHFEYPDYPGPVDPYPETFTIPTLRFYIVANSAQIVRVSDGRDVPASAVTVSIDYQSYQWSMQAALAGRAAHALVEGTDAEPVEVDVMVNGLTWRMVVDGWSLQQAWRNNGGPIRGRSRMAYLAPPYNSPRDYREQSGLLAQQLAAQELPPGWALDWGMVDWFVPAGAWQYQGLAPLDAIARIAAAGGGYVQSHPTEDKVLTDRLHPFAPWNLGAAVPDFQIPRAVMVQRASEKRPGSGVNGVILHGGPVGGIAAKVVRQGSAGDVLASTIVDALNVDTIPARERGIAAIAETLRQARETIQLPLSNNLGGLISVGSIVEIGDEVSAAFVGDWRGIVRGVSVNAQASMANNGGVKLKVRQQITVDRYFEE